MTASAAVPPAGSTAPPVVLPRVLAGQKALVTGANSGIGKLSRWPDRRPPML